MNSGDLLPHRSDTQAGRGCCGAVHECTMLSDCGTSHQPPYRTAESSPGWKQILVTVEAEELLFNLLDIQQTQRRTESMVLAALSLSLSALNVYVWRVRAFLLYVRSRFVLDSSCSYLRVDAEVFSGGKSQSQEVVALSSLLAIKLHQLPQLLHDLIRQRIKYTPQVMMIFKASS